MHICGRMDYVLVPFSRCLSPMRSRIFFHCIVLRLNIYLDLLIRGKIISGRKKTSPTDFYVEDLEPPYWILLPTVQLTSG